MLSCVAFDGVVSQPPLRLCSPEHTFLLESAR